MAISHTRSISSRCTGAFPSRTEWRRCSTGSVYLKIKGKSGTSKLRESASFAVITAAVVVSGLTFTPCTWRNRTHPVINTARRAARSDILLIFILRDFPSFKGERCQSTLVGSKFNLGEQLNSDTPNRLHQQHLLPRRRRCLFSVFDRK